MIRWLLFLLALSSAGLGLLTVTKIPEIISWQLAVLAGEFGYLVAALPAVLLFLTFFYNGVRAALTFWLSLAAVALLVQPCVQAWYIGRTLPERLRAAYGDPSPARPPRAPRPFAWSALLASPPTKTPSQVISFAPALSLDFNPHPAANQPSRPAPLVIVIHGGGWTTGTRGDIVSLDYELTRAGYAVADMSYRLAPKYEWPAQRDDVHAALLYLKSHAAELGIDPHRIVLLGRSAGGQIAEATAYAARDPAICGVIGLYSPADMLFAYQYGREDDVLKSPQLLRQFLGGPPATAKANYESASSYFSAGPHSPPTLLVHGKLDTLVWYRQSERLADKLASFGVKHLLLSLPWATHGVEYNPHGPSGQLTVYSIEWFLGAVTR
jgi:acetyl esterase/lipase